MDAEINNWATMFCMLNMRVISLVFGILLVLVGVAGFVVTGCQHPTALIPSYLGVVLIVCGALGLKASEKARKHIMHVAVLVALLGMIFTSRGLQNLPDLFKGTAEKPEAVLSKSATFILCGIYFILCIKSFVDVRRAMWAAKK